MITVVSAADSYDLTTLEAVQELVGITDTTLSPLLSALITRASAACDSFCHRVFAKEQVKETVGGTGTPRMTLIRTPIVSIDQIDYDGDTVSSDDYQIEHPERGWITYDNTFYASTLGKDIPKQDWEITYTAGWVLPSHSGTRDLPHDIEEACIEIVKSWYYARCRDGSLRTEEVVDVWQGTYSGQAIPMVARQLLNPWRVLNA